MKANDELIVVIPAFTEKTDKDVLIVLRKYYWLFQRIIDKSNRRINPDNRDWYVKHMDNNSDSDDDEEVTDDQRATKSAAL